MARFLQAEILCLRSAPAKRSEAMLFICLLLTAVVLPFSLSAQQEQADTVRVSLTITNVWDYVLLNSKAINIDQLKLDRSVEEVKTADAKRYPEAEIGGSYEKISNLAEYVNGLFGQTYDFPDHHTAYGLNTAIFFNIYNGKKLNLEIETLKLYNEIANEQKKLTTSEIKLLAASYYLIVKRNEVFKQLLIKDIEDQSRQLKHILDLQKGGVVLKSDGLRAELNLSRQKLLLVQINNDIAIAGQKLNILMGKPDNMTIDPVQNFNPDSLELRSYDEYLAIAMQQSFQIYIADKGLDEKKLEVKRSKANLLPSLGLYANYAYNFPQVSYYPYAITPWSLGSIGLKASFPLSAIYNNKHKVKAAELEFEQTKIELKDQQDKVRQNLNEGYLRFKEGLVRIAVAKKDIAQATENLRIINNSYFNQTSLITDLLDADTQPAAIAF